MKFQIYYLKIKAFFETILSKLVYNFHKRIKGVKSVKNLKYKERSNIYNKLDIHYKEQDFLDGKKSPIIVYFHGGGWSCYSKYIFTTLTRRLADMGYVVFNCNYSLAPKYKLNDIMQDAVKALKYATSVAKKYGGDPNKIILAGDSAGAHICSMLSAFSNDNTHAMGNLKDKLKALVLFYGVFNLKTALDSKFPKIRTYISASIHGKLNTEDGQKQLDKYSPVNYDISSFPPCFIASGEVDKLHKSQSLEFSNQLKKSGIMTQTVFFDDKEYRAMHAFMTIDGISTNIKVLEELKKFLGDVVNN